MGVRVVDLDLVDESRTTPTIGDVAGAPRRQLPTAVYLPATDGPAPLIVLAHGFNGHPDLFTALAGHWADAGYVVAVPRFPVSSNEFPIRDRRPSTRALPTCRRRPIDVTFLVAALGAADDDARAHWPAASMPTGSVCMACRSVP